MRAAYGEEIPYKEVEIPTTSEQRHGYWEAAASLQEADGLRPSDEAYARAERYVEGEISSSELTVQLAALHRGENDSREREADIVSARIVELLESSPFTLSPRTLVSIHASLFEGVFRKDWVGRYRTVNLTKEEPILGGRTVQYSNYSALGATLDYDFGMETDRDHGRVEDSAELRKIARFVANVWQSHPFREGNTRTIAVFTELYLRSLGADVDNGPFEGNGRLFRDALVRANFSDLSLGIREETAYLDAFLESVVNGSPYPFKHSDLNLHGIRVSDIDYRDDGPIDLSSESREEDEPR